MVRYGIFLFAMLAIAACGSARLEQERVNLVWPSPPDEPKIQYKGAVKSAVDVGAKTDGFDALKKPYGVAVDKAGRICVTDEGRVLLFDPVKHEQKYLGDKQGPGRLTEPLGIAVSRNGNIFVTDIAARKVFVYSPDGTFVAAIGGANAFEAPNGIAIDDALGRVYVVDSKKHRVSVYSLDGFSALSVIGSRGVGKDGRFNFPTNAAVDSRGDLYVVDTGNFRVQVFDKNGKYVRSIGKPGNRPGFFARPKGIAVDSEDHIYVADAAFQNVQVFDPTGRLLLFFGTGGWGPGRFTLPAGMTIDSRDRLYIVDQWPGNVQMFQYLGRSPQKQAGEAGREGK
jgi:DNA-binding beta-propeller fold protein YncE